MPCQDDGADARKDRIIVELRNRLATAVADVQAAQRARVDAEARARDVAKDLAVKRAAVDALRGKVADLEGVAASAAEVGTACSRSPCASLCAQCLCVSVSLCLCVSVSLCLCVSVCVSVSLCLCVCVCVCVCSRTCCVACARDVLGRAGDVVSPARVTLDVTSLVVGSKARSLVI